MECDDDVDGAVPSQKHVPRMILGEKFQASLGGLGEKIQASLRGLRKIKRV